MATPSIARVKEVFEQWAMYDAVVQADYMRHSELVSALELWARTNGRPLRIVDLGCGDSWLATHAFRDAESISIRASTFRVGRRRRAKARRDWRVGRKLSPAIWPSFSVQCRRVGECGAGAIRCIIF
jgi:hypothetical protein